MKVEATINVSEDEEFDRTFDDVESLDELLAEIRDEWPEAQSVVLWFSL